MGCLFSYYWAVRQNAFFLPNKHILLYKIQVDQINSRSFLKLPSWSSLTCMLLDFFRWKNTRDSIKFSFGLRIWLKSVIWLCFQKAKDLRDTWVSFRHLWTSERSIILGQHGLTIKNCILMAVIQTRLTFLFTRIEMLG